MLWLGLSAHARRHDFASSVDWPWQYQLIAFAVFALASIPLWRRFAHRVEKAGDQPFLNRRADAFVGRVFTLEKPIVSGNGTVRIDDSVWRLSGPECPPAAASRSCARMRRRWWWSRRNSCHCEPVLRTARIGAVYATPRAADRADARCRRACRLRATITAVIFDALSSSSASLTS